MQVGTMQYTNVAINKMHVCTKLIIISYDFFHKHTNYFHQHTYMFYIILKNNDLLTNISD